MHLVQLFLPLSDNEGRPFPATHFAEVRDALTHRFGGLTAYARSPAVGLWGTDGEARDDLVVYEVMADELDRDWWSAFRQTLEQRFAQDELVVRAHRIERL